MLSAIVQLLIIAGLSSLYNVSAQTLSDPSDPLTSIKEAKIDNAGGIRYGISTSGYSAPPRDPSWAYFGVRFLNTSTELIDWRNYILTAVGIEENIFYAYGNYSDDLDPAVNFRWPVYDPKYAVPLAINISAIGRGLEPNSALTLSWPRLVLFIRWMVQISRQPWKNVTFECSLGLFPQPGQKIENVPVARGSYVPFKTPLWEQAPLALNPQGPQTS